jgi:hypothetical protein
VFQTVRHWWGSGRGKVTARLFLFELFVVIAGVLIAQGLANWVAREKSDEEMAEARGRFVHEQSENLAVAVSWRAAIPCFDQRMQEVMRAASTGTLDVALADRPEFADFVVSDIDSSVELGMRGRYGNSTADQFKAMQRSVSFAASNIGTIIHSWGRLSLADSRLGSVSGPDRTVVRTAAADIRAELRGLSFAVADFIALAERAGLRLPPRRDYGPAKRCDQIWRSGRIDPPLTIR